MEKVSWPSHFYLISKPPILTHSLTSPSVSRRIMPKYETIFHFFFTRILHICYLLFTPMPPERVHFCLGCKKTVKSIDGKISVFPRRSRLEATFRAIIPACHRCWQHRCQEFGTQSVRQHGRYPVKPKSFLNMKIAS